MVGIVDSRTSDCSHCAIRYGSHCFIEHQHYMLIPLIRHRILHATDLYPLDE